MKVKLGDIVGKVISGEWGEEDNDNTGTYIIRTTNFTNNGTINFDNIIKRKINKRNISSKFLLKGDIIIEKSGGSDNQPVGRVVFFDYIENTYLFNNFTGLLRIRDNNKWYPKFIFYNLFNNWQIGNTKFFENKTTGIRNLKLDNYISSIEIPLLPIEEQKKIANILDKVTSLISLRQEQLKKLDELIKSRFIEMFGDPVENNKKYNFIMGIDIFEFSSGKFLQTNKRITKGIPVYGGNGILFYTNNSLITEPTIIIGRVGALCGNIHLVQEPVWITDNAIYLKRIKDNIYNLVFLKYLMIKLNFNQYANSSGQPKITQETLYNIFYITPPLELQNKFASFVEEVEKNKEKVNNSLNKLDILKKALMQKYFG